MNIQHINPMTNFPCLGILINSGLQWYGMEMCTCYICSLCGKQFFVTTGGQILL